MCALLFLSVQRGWLELPPQQTRDA
ncbi:Putative lipoprotein (fragment) [Cupriavidus taiwanensis]